MKYSFPDLEPVCCSVSSSNCCFLTCIQIFQEAGPVVWYSHLFKNLPQFVVFFTIELFAICPYASTTALFSHASKVTLNILQDRLQQCVNQELPDVQHGFRKSRGTRDQIANIRWIMEKAREFQKNIYFCFTNYAKAFDCVDHNKP